MKDNSSLQRKKDLLFYKIVLGIGIVASVVAFSYPRNSSAFPRTLCLAMLFIAALSLFGILRSKPAGSGASENAADSKPQPRVFAKSPVLVFILTAVYIVALSTIGFFVSTYIFLFVVMYVLNYRNKAVLFAWPALLSVVLWAIFCAFLKVPTPEGVLF